MAIVRQTGGAVKPPSSPPDPLITPQESTAKESTAKEQRALRARRGMGYYKLIVLQARLLVDKMKIGYDYRRAIMGTIARAIDGKIVDKDEFLERLASLREEIEARAQRESRSDLCYWLKRRLFNQGIYCPRCQRKTDNLIEGLCSHCYWEVI